MALPDIKTKQDAIALSIANRSQKGFFDKLLLNDFGKNNVANSRSNVEKFMSRNDGNVEQTRMIRRIANNTDEMVLLLRNIKDGDGKKKDDLDWKKLLPLLPLVSGLMFPELTKGIIGGIKGLNLAGDIAKILKNGVDVGEAVKNGSKVIDAGTEAAKSAGKGAKILGMGAGVAKALGKFGNSKLATNAVRFGSVGAMGANVLDGDYVGAGMEGASLAAFEASRRAKSPKTKAILSAISLGTDGLIMGRDLINGDAGVGTAIGATGLAAAAAGAGIYARKNGAKAGIAGAAKFGAKSVGKLIPGVGLAIGAASAASRAQAGDYVGAAGEAVSGLASLIPGIGTMASLAIGAGLAYRDSQLANSKELKAGMDTMRRTTDVNRSLIATNNESIRRTSGAMAENAKGVKLSMGTLSKTLVGFTALFGTSLIGWLSDSQNIFKGVFTTLSGLSLKLGGFLKGKWDQMTGQDFGSTNGYAGKADQARLRTALGKGDLTGAKLGAVSSVFESGSRGVGTVSSGKGDHGGVSYGKHQMIAGTMTKFLNSKQGANYKNQFAGLTPGTAAFSAKYKEVAGRDGAAFEAAQKSYIDVNYYGVAKNDIMRKTGLDLNKRGRALQEMVYSTAVQYGPERVGSWLKSLYGNSASSMSDAAIITAIQNYKIKNNDVLMKSSDRGTRKGVADRAETEKQMLLNINAKNNGTAGADNLTKGNKVANATAQKTTATAGTATRKTQDMAKSIMQGAQGNKTPGIGVLKPGATGVANTSATSAGSAKSKEDKNVKGAAEWDLDKVVAVAVGNAKGRKATGDCAKYVRMALEKGALKGQIKGGIGNANDYPKSLSKIGWVSVGQNVTEWKKGDISVFMKTGSTAGQKFGHVAIWSGAVWVSDHVQQSVQPNVGLGNFPYSIWRPKHGISNGAAVMADVVSDDITKAGADTADGISAPENTSPIDAAIDAVSTSLGHLGAAFGNMDSVKSALDWVNSAKVDAPFQRQIGKADLSGFDLNMGSQGTYSYKGTAEGGKFSEADLYSQDAIRQLQGQDILGQAGAIPGIVRQQKGFDILGQAGSIPGIVRQQKGQDILGQAGSLGGIIRQGGNKNSKWWEKLFGNNQSSDLLKMFADMFGLGSVYDFGKGVATGENPWDAAGRTVIPTLQANVQEKEKVDGYISGLNRQREEALAQTNVDTTSGLENQPNISVTKSSGSTPDGMSMALITRNPDSIFREVSIAMMKASTT